MIPLRLLQLAALPLAVASLLFAASVVIAAWLLLGLLKKLCVRCRHRR